VPAIPFIVGAVISTVAIPFAAPVLLGAVGFGALGPVAGSALPGDLEKRSLTCHLTGTTAAVIQAGIGNVAAGSLFAGAQAVAMGAAVPALGYAIGTPVGGAIVALAASVL
jgi:hypothetical protein